jgi:antitoxin component YwqK of YwqJK toxin-antitoxin module
MWHENGQKRSEGNAVGGTNRTDMVKNGKWTMWDENGKKVSERTLNYSRDYK